MTLKDDEMFSCFVVFMALPGRYDCKTSKFRVNPNSRGLAPTCYDSIGQILVTGGVRLSWSDLGDWIGL